MDPALGMSAEMALAMADLAPVFAQAHHGSDTLKAILANTAEDLGNVGDFVGGIGVIVTLIYLALQIRQNSQLLRANTLATTAGANMPA